MTALVRSPEVPRPPAQSTRTRLKLHGRTLEENLVAVASGLVFAGCVVLRFWTPLPMWLDEAFTVNISRAPLHAIPHLLHANRPKIVDWVDYASTVEQARTGTFAKLVLSRAGRNHAIWYVWAPGYRTFGSDRQAIASDLAASRSQRNVVSEQSPDTPFEICEGENLYRYAAS